MANRRMVVKELSYSESFNSISEFAQNLYFFTTPHLDDFGKLDGNPVTIKARVIPLSKRSVKEVENAIRELMSVGFVDWYKVDGQKIIKYLSFEEDQTGLNKRTNSKYPDNPSNSENIQEVQRSSNPTEANRSEPNSTELNKSEGVANNKNGEITKKFKIIYPDQFDPSNDVELAAKETWKKLEPNKPQSFFPTYLAAAGKGLPENMFYQFVSEIRQSSNVRNPGKVFNKKVKDYLARQARQ